jgi:membrane protein required for colicin V production
VIFGRSGHLFIRGELKRMIWVDYVIIIVCTLFVANGFRKGLVQEIMGILGLVLAVLLALRYFQDVGYIISTRFNISENLGNVIGFVVVAFVIMVVVGIIAITWRRMIKLTPLSIIDKIFGAGFGFIKGGLVVMIILLALVSLQIPAVQDTLLNKSSVAREILVLAPKLYEKLDPLLPASMDKLMVTPEGIKIIRNDIDIDVDNDTPA